MFCEKVDWYNGGSLVDAPHAYSNVLRDKGPVVRVPHCNAVVVTESDETLQVMLETEHFSAVNAVTGGLVNLPFTLEGDGISDLIDAHCKQIDFADPIVCESGERPDGIEWRGNTR